MSDAWEWFGYRSVYGPAWRTVERWGYTNKFEYLNPDSPQDIAFVLAEVRRELGDVLDGIDAETVADAVRDAMEQRRPRC